MGIGGEGSRKNTYVYTYVYIYSFVCLCPCGHEKSRLRSADERLVQWEERSDVAGIWKKIGVQTKCAGSDLYCGFVCLSGLLSGLLFCAEWKKD